MRKVRIYSTTGQTNLQLEFQGTTFRELKELMSQNRVTYSGMKCVVGETKLTVEHDQALLPDGDFTLFIMPVKTKSGALSRSEAYAQIKSLIERDGDRARNHFNADKNYTNKGTDLLNSLLDSYGGGANLTPTVTKPEVEPVKARKISEVVEPVRASKTTSSNSTESMANQIDLVRKAKDLVKAVDAVLDGEEKKKTLREPLEALREALGMPVPEHVIEARKNKEVENKLKEEAQDLARGFGDVRL